MTRLEHFLSAHHIEAEQLAVETGITQKQMLRFVSGRNEPSRVAMLAIRRACARILRRRVAVGEVFDFDEPVIVTAEQGERFADAWYRYSCAADALSDALDETGIAVFPDLREAQSVDHGVVDEICERTFRAARGAIAAAFADAATEVLARESERGISIGYSPRPKQMAG